MHKGFGKVPKYLQKFKTQKEEQLKQKEMEKELAKCPPGTRRMGDEERLQILEDLKQTKQQLESQIMKLPITMKTMSMQKKKQDLEEQVDRVTASIATFSKPVVYVAI